MQSFLPTIILRHRRENLKKCSLRGLEGKSGFQFFSYPEPVLPDVAGYLLLSMEGKPLTKEDYAKGIVILDGTWRYAEKMLQNVPVLKTLETRSLPTGFRTAYPRRQEDCTEPERGLASIEAIYAAYRSMGRDVEGLLDTYHWKQQFLEINSPFLLESPKYD